LQQDLNPTFLNFPGNIEYETAMKKNSGKKMAGISGRFYTM